MKLINSNRVYRKKEGFESDTMEGLYLVWQQPIRHYIYANCKPLKQRFNALDREVNRLKDENGRLLFSDLDKMIYLSGTYQVLKTIDESQWEACDLIFISDAERVLRRVKEMDSLFITKEFEWSAGRIVLLVIIITLCIVFLFFAYTLFYD